MTFARYIFIVVFFLSSAQAMKRDANGQEAWLSKVSLIKDGRHMLVLKSRIKEVVITYDKFSGNGLGLVYYSWRKEPESLNPAQAKAYLKEWGYSSKPYFNMRDI